MVKLVIFVALFSALSVAEASVIRTTTSVSHDNDDDLMMTGNAAEGTCTEVPRSRDIGYCIDYVREAATGDPPTGSHLWACCSQMGNVDKACICEALKKAISKSGKQAQWEAEERMRMARRARNIPAMCRLGPQKCDWSSTSIGMI
uniref:Bifunctional inhibitor/plant lipid transfer protein/seed storage helical domain-containing protein n=1 Tax=Kalanchoe fedtschenkoi TaxID=63787 RepID=A0A7N0UQJ1_KALFE